jgi:hypothetical protein
VPAAERTRRRLRTLGEPRWLAEAEAGAAVGSSLRSSTPLAASRVTVLATVVRAMPVASAISRAVEFGTVADGSEDRLPIRAWPPERSLPRGRTGPACFERRSPHQLDGRAHYDLPGGSEHTFTVHTRAATRGTAFSSGGDPFVRGLLKILILKN